MGFKDYLDIVSSLITLVGILFFIYIYFRNPDERADKQLGMNRVACEEKHKRIDEIIIEMKDHYKETNNAIIAMKNGDIKHIYEEQRRLSEIQVKILTILEIREKERV